MLFNSFEFAIFLPIVFLLYWFFFSKNAKWQNMFIIIVSYFFYAWWDWRFLSLLIVITASCYFSAILIEKYNLQPQQLSDDKPRRPKVWWILFSTVVLNIGILFYFKYFNFFIDSFIDAFAVFGKELNVTTLKIILPIGISFFTFTALSYTIDVYRGTIKTTKDTLSFFAYVSFFPSLFCGPISRATTQLPQYFHKRVFEYQSGVNGLKLILWGLFMKLCVADRLGMYVDAVYNNIGQHNGTSALLASFLYAFQLYCDFGGYSLIAIGVGKLFGMELLQNFIRPYFSTSFAEYWKRNHISLTQWLIDYIYYPLVGSSSSLRYWNLCMIFTFIISGLWHGAAWTFILWGIYQGIFIVISTNNAKRRKKFEKKHQLQNNRVYRTLTIFTTFAIVCFGLIFFRATSVADAFEVIKKIFTEQGSLFIDATTLAYGLLALMILIIKDWKDEYNLKLNFMSSKYRVVRYISVVGLIGFILLFGTLDGGQFIYFQF